MRVLENSELFASAEEGPGSLLRLPVRITYRYGREKRTLVHRSSAGFSCFFFSVVWEGGGDCGRSGIGVLRVAVERVGRYC